MIYLDTSVMLAALLAEDRRPDAAFWEHQLVASRLLEYETWVRLNARGLRESHGDVAQAYLDRVSFLELNPVVLAAALEPFPAPVRTLDALHLASVIFLRSRRLDVELATFDRRMRQAAMPLAIPIFEVPIVES